MDNCIKGPILRLFLVFLCAFSFATCTLENKTSTTSEDISSEVVLSLDSLYSFKIESTKEVTIDRIRNIVVFNHEEDKIAWVNDDKKEIFVTDTNGNHIYNFGSIGRGPTEFLEISSIGFNINNDLVIYDGRQDLFKKFREPGNLIQIYDGIIDDGYWLVSRKLFLSNDYLYFGIREAKKANRNNFWESKTIGIYNSSFDLVKNIGSYDPTLTNEDYLYTFPVINVDISTGLIYTAHRILPYVQVFTSPEGELVTRFGNKSPSFHFAEDEAKLSDPIRTRRQKNLAQSFVEENFVSDKYYFLHHASYTEDVITYGDTFYRESYLNVYEKNKPYKFLGEISLESIPIYVSHDNKIYILQDNNPDNLIVSVYDFKVEH